MDELEIMQDSPVEFIESAFQEELWGRQREICNAVKSGKYTAVRSCHGVGKSFISARIALWFLYSFPDSKVITTAPTFRQVTDILWREMRVAKGKSRVYLKGDIHTTKLEVGNDWFAMGMSTDQPDRFQGFHAVNMLLVMDEAAGINEEIFTASEGLLSSKNAHCLYIGNPTNLAGTFYNSFKLPNVKKVHISAFDSPNFIANGITIEDIRNDTWQDKVKDLPRPYLVTPEWVADKYRRWGESNPMWSARVMGDFPLQGEDTLIPLSLIEAAVDRDMEVKEDDVEQIGVDVARFGVDKTQLYFRKGSKVLDGASYGMINTMEVAARTRDMAAFHPRASICIDEIGVGGGVVDRLQQMMKSRDVVGVNIGLPANDPEMFANLRAEIYWGLRDRFIGGSISIPNDDELVAQLANIRYKYTPKGQIAIEPKEEMKKRGLDSPDKADALTLAFGKFKSKPALIQFMASAYGQV